MMDFSQVVYDRLSDETFGNGGETLFERITDVYDTETLHDERIVAVREEPNCTLYSTREMSRMKYGHPGIFLLTLHGAMTGFDSRCVNLL